jgi:hypothetical protein
MEYYLALNRSKLANPEKKKRNLECTSLSERRLSEKAAGFMIPTLTFWKRQNYADSEKDSKLSGEGRLGRESTGNS